MSTDERGCWVRLDGLSGAAAWRWLPEAQRIRLATWEQLALFVHPDITHHGQWAVTEGTTGLCVSGRWRTRKDAIAAAAARLAKAGPARVQAAIDRVQEAQGPPPPPPNERRHQA